MRRILRKVAEGEVENIGDISTLLDPLIVEALLTEETRHRTAALGGGLLITLRGVNLNPHSDPEDMISIRVWIDE